MSTPDSNMNFVANGTNFSGITVRIRSLAGGIIACKTKTKQFTDRGYIEEEAPVD